MKEMIIHEEILRPFYNIKQDFQIPVRTACVCIKSADISFRNGTCRNSSKGQEFGGNIYSCNACYNV